MRKGLGRRLDIKLKFQASLRFCWNFLISSEPILSRLITCEATRMKSLLHNKNYFILAIKSCVVLQIKLGLKHSKLQAYCSHNAGLARKSFKEWIQTGSIFNTISHLEFVLHKFTIALKFMSYINRKLRPSYQTALNLCLRARLHDTRSALKPVSDFTSG